MTAPLSEYPGSLMHLETTRLRLLPLTADAIDALLTGNAARLGSLTGARFPEPLQPPPLTEEVLPLVRDHLRADPSQDGWWTWLVVRKDTNQAVGSAGFGGGPGHWASPASRGCAPASLRTTTPLSGLPKSWE